MTTARNRRLGLGVVDQVLSSASNMFVIFAVARVSSIVEFGSIALVFAVLTGVMSAGRGFLGTPLVLLRGSSSAVKQEARFANTVGAFMGLIFALFVAAIAMLFSAPSAVYIVALAIPIVVVQDLSRYYCIAIGKPGKAIASDGVWTLGSAALLTTTVFSKTLLNSTAILTFWTGFAAVAMVLLLAPLATYPTFSGLAGWWRVRLADRFRFGGSAAIGALGSLLIATIAGALVGAEAIAALRGAGSIMGPLNILYSALPLVLIPELNRGAVRTTEQVWRPLKKVASLSALVALAAGISAHSLPANLGQLILGDSWAVVQPLLLITAAEYAFLALWNSASIGLKTLLRSKSVLRVRLVQTSLSLVFTVVAAAAFHTAFAIAVSIAISSAVSALYARHLVLREAKFEMKGPTPEI